LAVIFFVFAAIAVPTFNYIDKKIEFKAFLKQRFTYTKIYDEKYVDPKTATIEAPKKKRNVIVLYLESLETTYASKELGGYQEKNLIPGLTKIAKENVSFTDREKGKLGGTHNPTGTTWTTGSVLASSSGVPFSFRIGKNKKEGAEADETFANGLYTLGDFLDKEGYKQVFMCGSDATFGRKKAYYTTHGDFEIDDYYYAISEGYIDKDYHVWWGLEDLKLYKMAKDRLTELSKSSKPFNFTLLTVDTHHVGGYKCSACKPSPYGDTASVIECADRQATDFINWCKKQDFYKNTTIIVMGDHPRMDTNLVKDAELYEREAYDCILNPAVSTKGLNEKRLATTMDMLPTTLAAMGYKIDGERLGLGTNLFSDKKTLAEEMGYDKFDDQLGRSSKYYLKNFE
ncbi:MAG: LTA synthase family protein, partial [Lawsonibacter sp.]